jgi:hypothetical protein
MSEHLTKMRPSPPSDLPRRRRIVVGARSRKSATSSSGGRSAPPTPLLQWKNDSADAAGQTGTVRAAQSASARKLAAAIWKLGFEVCSRDPYKIFTSFFVSYFPYSRYCLMIYCCKNYSQSTVWS